MMKEYATNSGAPLPEVDPAAYPAGAEPLEAVLDSEFAHIPLHLLIGSPTNPRKTFTPAKLAELADSIRESGVHQPILVRPLPGSRMAETFDTGQPGTPRPTHEIVAGERRYRASVIAGASSIPAMVRRLSDAQVLEIQLIENLQRDDLSELEEAEGYERLMQHSSLNADQVGAKIGKSRSYVYARLKLLDLSGECQAALRAGSLDASRALLIARIPDGKLQLKALKYATEAHSGEVPSVRLLQVWLRQNVMLPLERAPFQITDARLVEAAGSCKECPKRTGANPDIFADVQGADICTDPPCYNKKTEAHQLRNLAKAEAKGMRLVSGSEAGSICYERSSNLRGYSPLNQVREDAGGQRLDQLLGKDFEGAVLIENPFTHELIEAVPTAEAEGVLLARGLVKAVVEPKAKADRVELEIEQIKKRVERDIETEFREAAYNAIAQSVRQTPAGSSRLVTPQLLRAWLISRVDEEPAEEVAAALQMALEAEKVESQREKAVLRHIRAAESATIVQAAVLLMIANDRTLPRWQEVTNETPLFNPVAASQRIDLPGLRAQVTKDVKTRIAGEIAALKAQLKPEKPPAKTAPLAQPAPAPNADAKTGKALVKAPPLRKPRLSAQEAQSGIAAAMQGIEAGQVPCPDAPAGESVQAQAQGQQVISPAQTAQGALPMGFAVGQRVKVLANVSARHSKWIGKTGTVTARMGDRAWDVAFRGRSGGLASFDAGELEVVQS